MIFYDDAKDADYMETKTAKQLAVLEHTHILNSIGETRKIRMSCKSSFISVIQLKR